MNALRLRRKNNRGQALTEYVLLIAIIAASAFILYGPLKNIMALLEKPLRQDFKYVYKYGDPKTCGFDDEEAPCGGTPVRHPRYFLPDNSRMFGR